MGSWLKPQKPRQKRRLPRLRQQQLILLMQEQRYRLLANRDLRLPHRGSAAETAAATHSGNG